jgi:HSP20 family molecular chaperone IbpA
MSNIVKAFSDLLDYNNDSLYWSWQSTTSDRCFSRTDTINDKKVFIIECEVPGVEKENINVEYDNKQCKLVVDAKRKEKENVIKSFSYAFKIDPEKINTDDYFLNLKNGILEICFSFKEKENKETIRKLIFKE